jgi:disulfide bond formation protein DsbB
MPETKEKIDAEWGILFGCWLIAGVAVLGSLFYSEIVKFPPCSLCWYQRIALFPLALLFTQGLLSFDRSVVRFTLPLAGFGWVVALYHNLLYAGIIPEALSPCSQGVPCTKQYPKLLGIFSIPMLSLLTFTALLVLLFLLRKRLPK